MKTKITLFLLVSFVMVSCTKWQGSGAHDQIKPTTENSIYEGYLYSTHLTYEKEKLEARKKELDAIIANNQGNDAIKDELEMVAKQLDENKTEHSTIIDLNNFAGITFKIGPLPPCPKSECVLPPELRYIISQRNTFAKVGFYDSNFTQVNEDNDSSPIGYKRLRKHFNVQNVLALDGFSGAVTISVKRLNSNGKFITYKLKGFFEKVN